MSYGSCRRMRFGVFMAPFHRFGENPTLAYKRDLELIEQLDRLGYEEAWVGEHHSYGREIIGDPVSFIAAAAQRTHRIRLGTGVTSLPYYHPFIVADRMVQLDHMTEGRVMLGVGPGALPSDAYMMGIEPVQLRARMNEALDGVMALLKAKAPVSMETEWFTLRDARLQLASYTSPHLPVSVATTFSPSGAMAAGKHGVGLLSLAGADNAAFERTWGWVEEAAAVHHKTVDRANWGVVIPVVHLADSRRQALDDIKDGHVGRAFIGDRPKASVTAAGTFGGVASGSLEEQAERGAIIVGTPDEAIETINRLQERAGGFGCLLAMAHEWTTTEKTLRSYELFARYVMPRFQGQIETIDANCDWIESNVETLFNIAPAYVKAFADAGKEMPAKMKERIERLHRLRGDGVATPVGD
jgi:limonene 1,2-monooxygenase